MKSSEIKTDTSTHNFSVKIAVATMVATAVTFTISVLTPPLSGPFCKGECITYPFTEAVSRFPRDYYWMVPAIFISLLFMILMVCIYQYTEQENKLYSLIALLFGLLSSGILSIDYFIQLTVVQSSLLKGEIDGIAILSQYNPHGVFIALEEIGYFLMSLAMFFAIPAFTSTTVFKKAIRTVFLLNFLLNILSFIIISFLYGIEREYRFEVATITLNWLTLLIASYLMSRLFKSHSSA